MRDAGHDEPVHVFENVRERLAPFRRACGQPRRNLAGRDPGQHRPLAHVAQIVRDPRRGVVQGLAEFFGTRTDLGRHDPSG